MSDPCSTLIVYYLYLLFSVSSYAFCYALSHLPSSGRALDLACILLWSPGPAQISPHSSALLLFWNPWNYWCLEGTHNHQRVLTMMSWISRDIKPLLQHNSGNNLIFVPWLRPVDTVYVDRSQESNTFFSSKWMEVRFIQPLWLEFLLQRLVHTCLGHNTLNSTECLFMYGRAVQVLLTVQYIWTHTMWVLIR